MNDPDNKSICRTRHTLLERVKNQEDKESWKEFISYYEQYIYNILRSIKIPELDAEEICHEIIVKLWKKMPQISYDRDKGKFRHWLGAVIRNAANLYFNKKNKETRVFENQDGENLAQNTDETSSYDIDKVIAEEWSSYISGLAWESVKERFQKPVQKVFALHAEGKSTKEIAEICNIQEGTVRTYIARIRKYLKDEIELFNKDLL